MKIKVGDKVTVIAGRDKGKQGTVIKTLRSSDKVVVEGVNIVKKHIKPSGGEDGRIAEMESPIHVSNVMLYDDKAKKGVRTSYEIKDGKKVRISKKSDKKFD